MNDGDVFRVFGQPGGQVGNKHGNHAQRRRVVVGKRIARDCAIELVGVVCVGDVGCVSLAGQDRPLPALALTAVFRVGTSVGHSLACQPLMQRLHCNAHSQIVHPILFAMLCVEEAPDVLSSIAIEGFKVGGRPAHDDEAVSDVDEVQIKAQLGVDMPRLGARHEPPNKVCHPGREEAGVWG